MIRDIKIPMEKRAFFNEKALAVANGVDAGSVTREDVAMCFSGKGNLNDLERKDYSNFHQYRAARNETDQGQHFTPYAICAYVMGCMQPDIHDTLADFCCGKASIFEFFPTQQNCYGCDIDVNTVRIGKYLYPDATIENKDIRYLETDTKYDICFLNAPFGQSWNEGLSEDVCLKKSIAALKPGGILAIIVPASYLSDPYMDSNRVKGLDETLRHIVTVALPSDAFVYTSSYQTKLVFFQRRSEHLEPKPFSFDVEQFLDYKEVYNKYILPVQESRKTLRNKLLLEYKRTVDHTLQETIEKLLYDIGRHPYTRVHLRACRDLYERFLNQKQPAHVSLKDWEELRIRKEDVIKELKRVLRLQNQKAPTGCRLVKIKNFLAYKTEETIHVVADINHLVSANDVSFDETEFGSLLRRKRRQYVVQSAPMSESVIPDSVTEFLDDLELVDGEGNGINLTDTQRRDISCCIVKNASCLCWEQGSGKTLAAMAVGLYRYAHQHVKNVMVVGTAISVQTTWEDMLPEQNIPYVRIQKVADLLCVKPGDFILISFEMLVKQKRAIKKFARKLGNHLQLVVDEADSLTSPSSARTKATLDCFRKLPFVLATTGTLTRNHAAEIWSNLELMYNNSVLMLCTCKEIFEHDGDKKLVAKANEHEGPFPAYTKGYKLFQACFSPERVTVFGEMQSNQDIYNADKLQEILLRCSITRRLEDLAGRKLMEPEQVPIRMNSSEEEIYRVAVEEFYKMEQYFAKTGDQRKDAMLKILNQLILMLRICAAANQFAEYKDERLPEKLQKTIDLCALYSNERVSIGVRHVSVANKYVSAIRNAFPGRQVFLLTGAKDSIAARKRIIYGPFKKDPNAILICTQQALSASININYVHVCIIPELFYNLAAVSQFYGRFIRFNNARATKVIFITYKNSIEENLLAMILAKEKINEFMKGKSVERDDLYEKYGLQPGMLENLVTKEKDQYGVVHIRWGEQKICASA